SSRRLERARPRSVLCVVSGIRRARTPAAARCPQSHQQSAEEVVVSGQWSVRRVLAFIQLLLQAYAETLNKRLWQIAKACRGGRPCPPQTTPAYTGATTEGRPYMQTESAIMRQLPAVDFAIKENMS